MISYNSICGKEDKRVLKKYSLSVNIRKDEITDIIDSLLDIDLSKVDKFSANLINKDLDYLEQLELKKDISVMLKLSLLNNNTIVNEPLSVYAVRLLEPKRVVAFDISDILKALAFRHLHYEFGYDNLDIENNLSDTRLVVRNKPDSLLKLVNKNIDSFKLLKDFKIHNLSYVSSDMGYIYDHFSNKIPVKDNYNPVLKSTFSYATLFSFIELGKQFIDLEVQYKPLGCIGTNLYFLLGNEGDVSKASKMQLVVELFGRKFKFDLESLYGGFRDNVD